MSRFLRGATLGVAAAGMLFGVAGSHPLRPLRPSSTVNFGQASPPAKKAAPLVWRTDWDQAFLEARTKKAPVLLVVAFPTCKWWIKMERTSFRDEKVLSLARTALPVLLQGEEDGLLFQRFKVAECPLVAIFDLEGNEIARLEGHQEPEAFHAWLKRSLVRAAEKNRR